MNEALADLVGRRIKVWQGGRESYYYTEEGTLEAYDHPWLRLRGDTGEVVCLCAYSIRMLRPAEVARPPEPEEYSAA
jgi:hypothetical protein